jgi:hypothetical protein
MRFMIIVKATKDSEAGVTPEEALIARMADYHQNLVKAGVLLDASGLEPSADGWRVRYDGEKRTLIDGPFAEAKEQVPMAWRLLAPAPLDRASGVPPRMNAMEVMRIGRKRSRQASKVDSIRPRPDWRRVLANSMMRMAFFADRPITAISPTSR